MTGAPVLALHSVSKRFGAVQALTDVELQVRAGEVVALVGDNGAGKSTLVKTIAGVHPIDGGVIGRPTGEIVLRTAVLAAAAFAAAYVLNQASGVPNALVIFLGLLVVADFVLRRTSFGRKIFAVGGNIEASRRAGISVPMIRIAVYTISGTFAALGGLAIAGTTNAAGQSGADPNNLILAIAAAVIGGTSLFGGRGRIWSALLGVLVIESINAGLYLKGLTLDIQYTITGAVLLAAVVVDSLSRRSQKSSGRG